MTNASMVRCCSAAANAKTMWRRPTHGRPMAIAIAIDLGGGLEAYMKRERREEGVATSYYIGKLRFSPFFSFQFGTKVFPASKNSLFEQYYGKLTE